MHSSQQEDPAFSMEILRSFQKPLERLIAESVEIASGGADYVMNSKGEWGASTIPRLTIEIGDKTKQDDYRGKLQGVRKLYQSNPTESKQLNSSKANLQADPPKIRGYSMKTNNCNTNQQGEKKREGERQPNQANSKKPRLHSLNEPQVTGSNQDDDVPIKRKTLMARTAQPAYRQTTLHSWIDLSSQDQAIYSSSS